MGVVGGETSERRSGDDCGRPWPRAPILTKHTQTRTSRDGDTHRTCHVVMLSREADQRVRLMTRCAPLPERLQSPTNTSLSSSTIVRTRIPVRNFSKLLVAYTRSRRWSSRGGREKWQITPYLTTLLKTSDNDASHAHASSLRTHTTRAVAVPVLFSFHRPSYRA
jgi:hypothetical protein